MLAACEVGAEENKKEKTATRGIKALITFVLDIYL
jgi:hypothetical protein